MCINKPWKLHSRLPVFLGHHQFGLTLVQDWRWFEHREAYARSHDQLHWPVVMTKRLVPASGARDAARGRMEAQDLP